MRGKGTGRIRSSRQNRKRRVRIRRNGHESLSSLRIQNPVLGGRIASAESSGLDRVLQDCLCEPWPPPGGGMVEQPSDGDGAGEVRVFQGVTTRTDPSRTERLHPGKAQ